MFWIIVYGFMIALLAYFFITLLGPTSGAPHTYQTSRKKMHQFKMKELEDVKLNEAKSRKNLRQHYKDLAQMYKDGVSDIYDSVGNKLKGIEPDAERAIENIKKAVGYGWKSGLIELGNLYYYGMHKLKPDLKKAEKYYTSALQNVKRPDLIQYIQSKLRGIFNTLHNTTVGSALNTPNYGPSKLGSLDSITSNFGLSVKNLPDDVPAPPTIPEPRTYHISRNPQGVAAQTQVAQTQVAQPQVAQPLAVNFENGDETQLKNDSQNVHDSGVQASMRQAVRRLMAETNVDKGKVYKNLQDIRIYINNLPDSDRKKDALKALDAMERNDMPLSSTQMKEVDTLALVWERMQQKQHEENRDMLKSNFVNELAECIEFGEPVCSTGRVSRVLDTLNQVDSAVNIKPSYVLTNEMLSKAANLRDNMMKEMTPHECELINSEGNNVIQNKFEEDFKNKLREVLGKDYVESGLISQAHLDRELGKWLEHI
jgi:hypothetical protein